MEGQTIRGSGQNDRETIMKTFKEYENIDIKCEDKYNVISLLKND